MFNPTSTSSGWYELAVLESLALSPNASFGTSLFQESGTVFVGAPGQDNSTGLVLTFLVTSTTTSPTSSDSALSTGAVVGIAVGSVAAVALVATGAYFFLFRSSSQPRPTTSELRPSNTSPVPDFGVPAHSVDHRGSVTGRSSLTILQATDSPMAALPNNVAGGNDSL